MLLPGKVLYVVSLGLKILHLRLWIPEFWFEVVESGIFSENLPQKPNPKPQKPQELECAAVESLGVDVRTFTALVMKFEPWEARRGWGLGF